MMTFYNFFSIFINFYMIFPCKNNCFL